MPASLPFLTSYDPSGTSEGTLDPLGLYQIADQLAIQLVPAVRERMQRIRFLTAMAVGALVTDQIEDDPRLRDASPYLIWEWLVVESMIRSKHDGSSLWGVPGTLVVRRALDQRGYIDARSYLKTPRIFGFHGVYKRLATHLGLLDVHLRAGPNAEGLVDAWARGLGMRGISDARQLISRWAAGVRQSLREQPPRTKAAWGTDGWTELAESLAPAGGRSRERRYIRDLLHASGDRRLGAFTTLWRLQADFDDDNFREEALHDRLEQVEPAWGSLLAAIRAYESFARSLQDGFDVLRAEAARPDYQGFVVSRIRDDPEFTLSVQDLHRRFEVAHHGLGEVNLHNLSLHNLFDERFGAFAEPMDAASVALALCSHHEAVQRAKSADGKHPWFDRLGGDRIYIRHAYRIRRRAIEPGHYLHDYRGTPIRRFYSDLS
jgi:hypothetical protein